MSERVEDGGLLARVAELEAVVARQDEALKFYAEAWCFGTNKRYGGLEWKPKESLLDDCGNIAREARSPSEPLNARTQGVEVGR